jgi:hypothetical protein
MRTHARLPRRTASTCRSQRNRSSPATFRRAYPAYACVRRTDKAPRKSPEKLESSTRVPARTRWSGRCAYAKEREQPNELVAGVIDNRATSGLKPDEATGHGLPYAAVWAAALLNVGRAPVSPEKLGGRAGPSGSRPDEPAGRGVCPMQLRGRVPYSISTLCPRAPEGLGPVGDWSLR